jgi:pilus assembly protein CpaE
VSAERRCLVVGADGAVTASVSATIAAAPGLAAVGVVEPAAALSGLRPAADAVLVCDGGGHAALEVGSALLRGGMESPLILLSGSVDVATYRAALAVGARGLLPLPPDPHDLRAAVVDAAAAGVAGGASPHRSGRAVAVCAAKGGSGASTVALALAVAAGGLLVDLAGGFDDAAARLGCEPRRTLADVAGLDDALGGEALRSLMLRHPSGLRLVARPSGPSIDAIVSAGLGRALVREGRLAAALVALDTGVAGAPYAASVAQPSDRVLLVATPDQLAVDCAARAVLWLEGAGVPASSIALVVNRWSKWEDLTLRGIERRVGIPLVAVIRDGELAGSLPRPPAALTSLADDLQAA